MCSTRPALAALVQLGGGARSASNAVRRVCSCHRKTWVKPATLARPGLQIRTESWSSLKFSGRVGRSQKPDLRDPSMAVTDNPTS